MQDGNADDSSSSLFQDQVPDHPFPPFCSICARSIILTSCPARIWHTTHPDTMAQRLMKFARLWLCIAKTSAHVAGRNWVWQAGLCGPVWIRTSLFLLYEWYVMFRAWISKSVQKVNISSPEDGTEDLYRHIYYYMPFRPADDVAGMSFSDLLHNFTTTVSCKLYALLHNVY